MTITELCKKAHAQAIEKGFWIPREDVVKGKLPKVRYRNLSELLMLVVTELGEACEALRHDNRQNTSSVLKMKWSKDTFEDELADAVIRICDLAQSESIDLEWQIEKKMQYNQTREHRHGKAF